MKRMQYVYRSNNIHQNLTSRGFNMLYYGAKVVWNIRLKGDVFCLPGSIRTFPYYINAIAPTEWVEQLPWFLRHRGRHSGPSFKWLASSRLCRQAGSRATVL